MGSSGIRAGLEVRFRLVALTAALLLLPTGMMLMPFGGEVGDSVPPSPGGEGLQRDRFVQGSSHRVRRAPVGPSSSLLPSEDVARDRIRTSLAALEDSLLNDPLDRASWECRTRAVAASLGDSAVPLLLELGGDEICSDVRRIAAAELLRALHATSDERIGSLPPVMLSALRGAVYEGDRNAAVHTAAGRALAALGERSDLDRLLRVLGDDGDPVSRNRASWFLRAARHEDAALGLTQLAREGEDTYVSELALATLAGWARERGQAAPSNPHSPLLALQIHPLLHDESRSLKLRCRALSTLVALGTDGIVDEIRILVRDENVNAELRRRATSALARLGTQEAIAILEEVGDSSVGRETTRLAFAESWVRAEAATTRRSPADHAAWDTLIHCAADSASPGERRRALYSLGRLDDARSRSVVSWSARTDPDPTVRAAAVWALGKGTEEPGAITALEEARLEDASAEVRRLAEQALASSGSRSPSR